MHSARLSPRQTQHFWLPDSPKHLFDLTPFTPLSAGIQREREERLFSEDTLGFSPTHHTHTRFDSSFALLPFLRMMPPPPFNDDLFTTR